MNQRCATMRQQGKCSDVSLELVVRNYSELINFLRI